MILATTASATYAGFTVVPTAAINPYTKPDPAAYWGRQLSQPKSPDLAQALRFSSRPTTKKMLINQYIRAWLSGLQSRMLNNPPPVDANTDSDKMLKFTVDFAETQPFVYGLMMFHVDYLAADVGLSEKEIETIIEAKAIIGNKLAVHPSVRTAGTSDPAYISLFNHLQTAKAVA